MVLPPVVAIVGPTATGKSDLAIAIAELIDAEIVNADAMQLYRGMDIGTAKVPVAERRGVRHHLLDILEPTDDASVADYQQLAREVVEGAQRRGRRIVVVGGSGLYVRAFLDRMDFPGTSPTVRAALEARAEADGFRMLHDELAQRDPVAAMSIAPQNGRRIIRALEVITLTGRPYSATLPRYEDWVPTVHIGLDCDRAVLDDRIARRADRMMAEGLVDETRVVLRGGIGRTASRAVGYAQVIELLAGRTAEAEVAPAIAAATRRLSRKQMGWFGRDPRVRWLDAQSPALVEEAAQLVERADTGNLQTPDRSPVRRTLGE